MEHGAAVAWKGDDGRRAVSESENGGSGESGTQRQRRRGAAQRTVGAARRKTVKAKPKDEAAEKSYPQCCMRRRDEDCGGGLGLHAKDRTKQVPQKAEAEQKRNG